MPPLPGQPAFLAVQRMLSLTRRIQRARTTITIRRAMYDASRDPRLSVYMRGRVVECGHKRLHDMKTRFGEGKQEAGDEER